MSTSVPWAHGARGLAVQADIDRREQRASDIQVDVVTNADGVATNEDDISFLAGIVQDIAALTPRLTLTPEDAARLEELAGEPAPLVAQVLPA